MTAEAGGVASAVRPGEGASAPLSVLHISTWDNVGGSARAAYRLHTGLKRLGMRSRMLVGHKSTDDPDVRVIGGRVGGEIERRWGRVVDGLGLQYFCYPSSFTLGRTRWVAEADVIQLFNTHGGYFSHLALGLLSRRRPVVWRLSDMWPMTGHCGYSYDCERWKNGCGSCPHLSEYPGLALDTTAFLWRVKRRIYETSRLTIVATSRWMADIVRRSPLLGRFPVHLIPNGVDTAVYRPLPKGAARQQLGMNAAGRVLLFSASSVSLERKGAAYLKEALRRMSEETLPPTTLLVVGEHAQEWQAAGRFPTTCLGAVRDDATMALVYAAADVLVLPTLAENLPNAIVEGMACGTPAVAFDVGGVSDVVRHLDTGYLVTLRDAADLAKGIALLLHDRGLRETLAGRCREAAVAEYSLELQARRFAALYSAVIERHRGPV